MANETVATAKGGPDAYAMSIQGNLLAPDLCDGDYAVFCPDAGQALRDEIAAIWPNGAAEPMVLRLATAVPPMDISGDNFAAALALHTNNGIRMISMDKIAKVHRLVDVVRAGSRTVEV